MLGPILTKQSHSPMGIPMDPYSCWHRVLYREEATTGIHVTSLSISE